MRSQSVVYLKVGQINTIEDITFFVTLSFTLTLQSLSDDCVSVELRVTEKLCLNGFSVCLFGWFIL